MSTRFRYTKTLAVVAAATLALTACSGTTGANSSDSKTATYWSMWKVGEPQQKVIAGAIADFEKQTGDTINVQWQGRTNTKKIIPALNTNNVPDIIDGSESNLAIALGNTGQALSMQPAYDSAVDGKKLSAQIPAKFLAVNNIKDSSGQPWMVPYSLSSDGIWFNAAKNPDLVTSPPTSWDALAALMNKEKAAGQTPLAADADIAGYNAYWFVSALVHAEGPGAFAKIAADKTGAGWDSPAVLAAAKTVQQIVDNGYLIKGYNASKWPAQQQAWATGGADLLFNGSWIPTETGSYASPGFKYASFPYPNTAGQPTMARVDFVGFAIPKKAKNPSVAQKLAAFLMTKKYQDAIGTVAKTLPVRADATVSPELASVSKTIADASEIYMGNDGVTYAGYMEKNFNPTDDELFSGKIDAAQFVSQMKAKTIAYWKAQG
ncbi:ABC transporter substrate-binding protein [Arthrobacter dokdonensis]|uniref:ABC transporter substrate-binding protein n=1 Tax=Arthrobacter dokdonellae TaxID=2211210 RepID=UPI000DE5A261|nr:ABC transporter substrate-binding protein [Arthrobacter dokdonellae]